MTDTSVVLKTGVAFTQEQGVTLSLDYALPEIVTPGSAGHAPQSNARGGVPVVMYIHGGGWLSGDRAGDAERQRMLQMARSGFFSVSVSYRLTGIAAFPAQILDIWAAVKWLCGAGSALGADASRIGAWSHSAGGHLAALFALTADAAARGGDGPPITAVVPVSAPTNLRLMGGSHQNADSAESKLIGAPIEVNRTLADRASPVTYAASTAPAASATTPAFLIVHGESDLVVPFAQAEELHPRHRAPGPAPASDW